MTSNMSQFNPLSEYVSDSVLKRALIVPGGTIVMEYVNIPGMLGLGGQVGLFINIAIAVVAGEYLMGNMGSTGKA